LLAVAGAHRFPFAAEGALGAGGLLAVEVDGEVLLGVAAAAARAAEAGTSFHAGYARRAGIEGTIHQATSHGARRARYRSLPKTRLDHAYMASALNLIRLHAYWTGTALDRQRTSHLARLEHNLAT